MRALVLEDSGPTLIREYQDPDPGDEALRRLLVAGICATDIEFIRGYMHHRGVLGHEWVGMVEDAPDRSWIGQPVIIPVDMGRYSDVLAGIEGDRDETFASSCHGALRRLSRTKARKAARGGSIFRELRDRGIVVRGSSKRTIAEEIPEAYNDVADMVDVVDRVGIARKVARLVPLAVIKG